MTKKGKVRATLGAGILIGGVAMFGGIANQNAQAPPSRPKPLRIDAPGSAPLWLDNKDQKCSAGVTHADCKRAFRR